MHWVNFNSFLGCQYGEQVLRSCLYLLWSHLVGTEVFYLRRSFEKYIRCIIKLIANLCVQNLNPQNRSRGSLHWYAGEGNSVFVAACLKWA